MMVAIAEDQALTVTVPSEADLVRLARQAKRKHRRNKKRMKNFRFPPGFDPVAMPRVAQAFQRALQLQ